MTENNNILLIGAECSRVKGHCSGAFYSYSYDSATASWIVSQLVTPPSYGENQLFGNSIESLGNTWLFVGAPGLQGSNSTSIGALYIYKWAASSGKWEYLTALFPASQSIAIPMWNMIDKNNLGFGTSFSVLGQEDGFILVVGAKHELNGNGQVYVYHSTNGNLILEQVLTSPQDAMPTEGSNFGHSVVIVSYKNYILTFISAPNAWSGISAARTGAIYIFYRFSDNSSGVSPEWFFLQKLEPAIAPSSSLNPQFGSSLFRIDN